MTDSTLFRFATAGSVDDGKSTLVGRLLHDSKVILADQLDAVTRASADRGFGGGSGAIDFALLTDGLRAEREQGITIDVAYRYFATDRRSFILADCPGHVQYTRNMVTGATTADAVVVLIDARNGVTTQTRRHLAVVRLLAVPHVIVAVNKIDLIGYDEAAFDSVAAAVKSVSDELGIDGAHVIPVSALEGDNVVDRSENTPWYGGPSLLELLETLGDVHELEECTADFRMPVQLVIRPQGGLAASVANPDEYRDYRAFAGQLSSGTVRVGDAVSVSPGGAESVVTSITVAGEHRQWASAPESVAIELADQIDAARGAVIAARGTLAAETDQIDAELFWLDPRPLAPGARVLVKSGTSTVQALVRSIDGRRNLDTLEREPSGSLEINDIGLVALKLAKPLPLADFAEHRQAGAFLVLHPQDGATLAAGIVGTAPQLAGV